MRVTRRFVLYAFLLQYLPCASRCFFLHGKRVCLRYSNDRRFCIFRRVRINRGKRQTRWKRSPSLELKTCYRFTNRVLCSTDHDIIVPFCIWFSKIDGKTSSDAISSRSRSTIRHSINQGSATFFLVFHREPHQKCK